VLETNKPAVQTEKTKHEAAKINPEPFVLRNSG
jgi:hypothetical protein